MRRAILSAIPVLGLVMMLQISIASRIMLLSGNVDLLLLVCQPGDARARPSGLDLGCGSQLAGRVGFGRSLVYLPYWISFSSGSSPIVGSSYLAGAAFGDVCCHIYRTLELLMLTFTQRIIFAVPSPLVMFSHRLLFLPFY